MKNGRIGYGIVGCGVIGPVHAKAVDLCKDAELVAVAVCDVIEERAEKLAREYGGIDFYTDYRDLLKRDDVDIISVCTPSGTHGEITIAAAEAGKHVLCEKPIEITLDKIDRMIEACHKNNVKLGCVFQRRTYQSSKFVREAVQGGKLGKMVLGDAYLKYYRSQAYYDSAGWRGTWELDGGGALMNQGIHGIDLLLWIMGDVESVYARTGALVRNIEVEDTAVALLRFKNGAYGVIEGTTSVNPGESTKLMFHGKKGTIILEDANITRFAITEGEDDRAVDQEIELEEESVGGVSDPAAIGIEGHVRLVADIVSAVKEDRDPMITGESARKSVELILAIYESSRTGREIVLR